MAATIEQQNKWQQRQLAAFRGEEHEGMRALLSVSCTLAVEELAAHRQQRDVKTRWAVAFKKARDAKERYVESEPPSDHSRSDSGIMRPAT